MTFIVIKSSEAVADAASPVLPKRDVAPAKVNFNFTGNNYNKTSEGPEPQDISNFETYDGAIITKEEETEIDKKVEETVDLINKSIVVNDTSKEEEKAISSNITVEE